VDKTNEDAPYTHLPNFTTLPYEIINKQSKIAGRKEGFYPKKLQTKLSSDVLFSAYSSYLPFAILTNVGLNNDCIIALNRQPTTDWCDRA